ncbi:methionine--tRNA ligase [candidate division WWE3 bacterium CG06_land_8_20_14_3_00_42_16]|uniref:Methionine--tRNA ligase n=3 Tax=Katanobacteria TaxID=422282 RepID=A0A2M7AMC8_UNCKA|nr:MAG: methionine--tRNA ligase [candidate division WWE3 bacterium CG06_land_8_20_14_3_00_42_16]PJA37146.1 MAG: methionine--tRNA ligase [candidate division WWE3 bacterium CG_4_9_14_3_um_filter_43_9]PJC69486.1 MAG: methionine--tRNA ligase [candidate division WWE3 bacterium CG_4_8_14_3_um_filter_42_11]
MAQGKFFITAAIPYVNAAPHLGHALEIIQADVTARYAKLIGHEVCFLTGADENSLKNVQSADKEGITPQQLCDQNSAKFRQLYRDLNISLNIFQRGTDQKKHWPGVYKLWQALEESGDIYKGKYAGYYCVGCEAFYQAGELKNGKLCPEHATPLEWIEEENYFFRLSRYQEALQHLIQSDEYKIIPSFRKNEILTFLNEGLQDFSISRSKKRARSWGIPVPGDPDQIIYVWIDALDIYMTGIGFGWDEANFAKWWPADLHVIGKGIIRFHALFWPALLMSAKLPLPRNLFVHGYITHGDQKMSKSLGNVVDPFPLIHKYGIDPLRYFLLSQIPAYQDGDFTEEKMRSAYQADLANGLGNLVSRVATLCEKSNLDLLKTDISLSETCPRYHATLKSFNFNLSLGLLWEQIREIDRFIDQKKPWELLQKGSPEIGKVLQAAVDEIRKIGLLLAPFLPQTALKIQDQFKNPKIKVQPSLFPRL